MRIQLCIHPTKLFLSPRFFKAPIPPLPLFPLSLSLCLYLCLSLPAQSIPDLTVQVTATALENPPRMQFDWPADPNASTYTVYRKALGAGVWGTSVAALPGTATTWTDSAAATGQAWEYRFVKSTPSYNGFGFAYAGIRMPAVEDRGKLILVVDTTWQDSIAAELKRLESDLVGDGWQVMRLDLSPTDSVIAVKNRILNTYSADTGRVKAVLLLGHVPVPYSGDLYPDGHTDHRGAWPADAYYGDMNGSWTDAFVSNATATRPENHNIPGDGKFDASVLPGAVELWVGRIDFANLGAFAAPEYELLRRYLDKDHAWRQGEVNIQTAGVVDDNFGVFPSENFATSGWRNFAPLVGSTNVQAGDFRTSLMGGNSKLWAYGCGAGSYTSASGVATTSDFATDSLAGVFTMIFGSYHGDWDSPNNVMRAALATKGHVLTCAWAGRPQWHYQTMGQGLPIGYSARMTQNNNGSLYTPGLFARYIHIALLGDPTLRMHVVRPAQNLTATAAGRDVTLTWTPSPDSVAGYYVYRAPTPEGPFVRITPDSVQLPQWVEACVPDGNWTYMVRALHLHDGPSGSYWNLSQGITDTAAVNAAPTLPVAGFTASIAGATVTFTDTSQNTTAWAWDFGDGNTSALQNPQHTYTASGIYTVTLIVANACDTDTATFVVTITLVHTVAALGGDWTLFPNPAAAVAHARGEGLERVYLYDLAGHMLCHVPAQGGSAQLSLHGLPAGMYVVQLVGEGRQRTLRLVRE